MLGFIYALKDPNTNEIRYIGQTKKDIHIRLKNHITEAKGKREKNKKKNWLKSLLKKEQFPVIIVLEACSQDSLNEREVYWINYYSTKTNLLNMTKGGSTYYSDRQFKYDSRIVHSYDKDTKEITTHKNTLDASKFCNGVRGSIPKAIHCKGLYKGHYWSYDISYFNNFQIPEKYYKCSYTVYNDNLHSSFNTLKSMMEFLNIPLTCKSVIEKRVKDGKEYKGYFFKYQRNPRKMQVHLKSDEFMETPEVDNHEPS